MKASSFINFKKSFALSPVDDFLPFLAEELTSTALAI
jgi:hypothetical protein